MLLRYHFCGVVGKVECYGLGSFSLIFREEANHTLQPVCEEVSTVPIDPDSVVVAVRSYRTWQQENQRFRIIGGKCAWNKITQACLEIVVR